MMEIHENHRIGRYQPRYRKKRKSGLGTVCLMAVVTLVVAAAAIGWSRKPNPRNPMIPLSTAEIHAETAGEHEKTQVPAAVAAFADKHGLPLSSYPKELLDLLERNPETEDFVLRYPLHVQRETDLSAYDRSTGVPLFLQWDPQWGYTSYGSGMLAVTGCGPTCLAMVGYYLTGDERFTPDGMAEFAIEHGYYSYGNGSYWTLIGEGGTQLGLDVTELPLDQSCIEQNLEAGNPIICVMGPGDFTTTGHFIVLTGIRDGKITVNDPNSRKRSERLWTYEEIQDQIDNLWAVRYLE